MLYITVLFLSTACPANRTVIPSQSGNSALDIVIDWPTTKMGDVAYVNCPCSGLTIGSNRAQLQASRFCGGDFINGAEWQMPVVDSCDFSDLARNICLIAEVRKSLSYSSPAILVFLVKMLSILMRVLYTIR